MERIPLSLSQVWAKTNRPANDDSYHPLICHLIDVACVAGVFWDDVLDTGVRRWVASSLGADESAAGRWVMYLAGLHDIGKACPSFQRQFRPAANMLRKNGIPLGDWNNKDVPHGSVSAIVLRDLLAERHHVPVHSAQTLATAIGGHHGIFPSSGDQQQLRGRIGQRPWIEIRAVVAEALADVVAPPPIEWPDQLSHALAMWLAGLVSVADWIGSNTTYFRIESRYSDEPDELDLTAYANRSRDRARNALQELGWLGWKSEGQPREWSDLFEFDPRPLQQAAVDLAPEIAPPGLLIAEAPMGEGKTEAAFYVTDYWSASGQRQGAYVGLPTMATSNQMFSRVRAFLEERYPDQVTNLQLLHGQAALSPEFTRLMRDGRFRTENLKVDDESVGGVIAAEWFTYRKRGLLAPYGVGTIDQALLAVLQTRHVFVRLFGLTHKTLILDEIHAYDTYMSVLIERLLEWCAALGTSVILLSATLPDERRRELAQAYARGLGDASLGELPAASYPRLSWVSREDTGARTFETSDEIRKEISVKWVAAEHPSESGPFVLGERLRDALRDGGCAAVICNTVRRAQEMYRALKPYFESDELDLLHARYLFGERDQREKYALQRFGKPDGKVVMQDGREVDVERPDKAVLVATQVIEQSLDLDFDLMVSDFAPVDLLLQRAGRLHRHERDDRPRGLRDEAQLWVIRPSVQSNGVPAFPDGTKAIYDEHVLLRSWLALDGRERIGLPGDLEALIEAAYATHDELPHLSEALAEYWAKTRQELEDSRSDESRQADTRDLGEPSFSGPLWRLVRHAREEESPELHPAHQALTRLAGPSVQVVCLFGMEQRAYLDLAHTAPIDYAAASDIEVVRLLLLNAVTISDRRVVHDLLDREPPPAWQRLALFRHHRLLLLDHEGEREVGKLRLRYDPELGMTLI